MIQQAIDHLYKTPISHPYYKSRIDLAVTMETQMLVGAVEFDGALAQLAKEILLAAWKEDAALDVADLLDLKATQEAAIF